MTITLYTISDDSRQLVKEADTDHKLGDLTAIFKGDVDILEPVLEIAYSASYAAANYVHIPSLNRYYFITKITAGAQRMYLECRVDVLMTYADEIKELYAVVARQEDKDKCMLYLNDKAFKAQSRKVLSTRYFPNSFSKDTSIILTIGGRS